MKQKNEPTIVRFAGNTVSVVLNVTLVVAILGYFGVQTTTFAALIAAMALAIGSAWPTPDNVLSFLGNNKICSGTIQNFPRIRIAAWN